MGGEVDGDVVHEDGERRAAAASRSEEEDRELVPRRRGPAALDLRLLRRRHVALVDASFEVEALDAVRRRPHESAAGELAASVASGYFLSKEVSGDGLATRAQLIRP